MENKKAWYKKKRYIIPLGILGLISILGINSSPSTPQTQAIVSLSENSTKITEPLELKNNLVIPPTTSVNNTDGLSNDNHYVNVDGNSVHSPAYSNFVPVGASARCRDGTYSFSQNRRGTCSHHGGVVEWL